MTKSTKRLLFYSAVVVFAVLSYIVVLYAQGYKYSFSESRFILTGAVHVKANEDAEVFLNNKFVNSTSFFGNSYTVSKLLPGEYKVRLGRENYSSWEKNVRIEEGLVTEFNKILLLPKSGDARESLEREIEGLLTIVPKKSPSPSPKLTPTPSPKLTGTKTPASTSSPQATPIPDEPFYIKNGVLIRNLDEQNQEKVAYLVSGFSISPDNKKIAWWDSSNQLWVMWLSDMDYQPYKKPGERDLLFRSSSKIKNAAWFKDSDHVVVDADRYRVIELDKRGGLNIIEI